MKVFLSDSMMMVYSTDRLCITKLMATLHYAYSAPLIWPSVKNSPRIRRSALDLGDELNNYLNIVTLF